MKNRCLVIGLTALTITAALAVTDIWAAHRLVHGNLKLALEIDSVVSVCPDGASSDGARLVIETISRLGFSGDSSWPDCEASRHVTAEQLLELSPFPPFLETVGEDSSNPIAGSVVVQTAEHGSKQISVFQGTADTTPSRFVPRVRGDASFSGDHLSTYLIVSDPGPTTRPKLFHVSWESDETSETAWKRKPALAFGFFAVQLIIASMIATAYRAGKRRRNPIPPLH